MAEKDRLPAGDREAARLLAIQMEKPKAKRGDLALTALFLSVIFAFALLFWVLPDRTMSERENRTLTTFPTFTVSRLFSGEYTKELGEYVADQFPGRDLFITVKAATERLLGKNENNGVLFGKDGTLIPREDFPDTLSLRENLTSLSAFAAFCAERDIPLTLAVTGRTADVLVEELPAGYGTAYSENLWASITASAAETGLRFVDLSAPLRQKAADGAYVYYRTDHHWTTLGAYYGYEELASTLGFTPSPLSDFDRRTVSLTFRGTAWSTAGAAWVEAEPMEFFRYAGDDTFVTSILDRGAETSFTGFYDESYLSGKDKYSAFLSGNHALVTVRGEGEGRETLLLLKDSFAHALSPFLARHYDLVIVDLRYYKQSVVPLLEEYSVDGVLALYNVDSLTVPDSQTMLLAGLS